MKFEFFSFFGCLNVICYLNTFISSLDSFLSFEKLCAVFFLWFRFQLRLTFFIFFWYRDTRFYRRSFTNSCFWYVVCSLREVKLLYEIILNIIISQIINYVILILFTGEILRKKIMLIVLFFFHWFLWILHWLDYSIKFYMRNSLHSS